MEVVIRQRERVLIVVQVELCDLRARMSILRHLFPSVGLTLKLMVSASTLASAHRLVRGGKMAVDPNMIIRVVYASW